MPECPKNLNGIQNDATKFFSCLDVNGTAVAQTFTCPLAQLFSEESQNCLDESTSNFAYATPTRDTTGMNFDTGGIINLIGSFGLHGLSLSK